MNILKMASNGDLLNNRQQKFIDNFSFMNLQAELIESEKKFDDVKKDGYTNNNELGEKFYIREFGGYPEMKFIHRKGDSLNDKKINYSNYYIQTKNCHHCKHSFQESEDDGHYSTICRKLSDKDSYILEDGYYRPHYELDNYHKGLFYVNILSLCDFFN